MPVESRIRFGWKFISLAAVLCLVAATLWPQRADAQGVPLTVRTLTGVWSGQERSAVGVMAVQVIFFANGTYSRTARAGALMTRDVGRYSIVRNWIHFRLHDYQPKQYRGRRLTRPMSDTWVVHRFNGRFLQARVGGGVVTVQRVR